MYYFNKQPIIITTLNGFGVLDFIYLLFNVAPFDFECFMDISSLNGF